MYLAQKVGAPLSMSGVQVATVDPRAPAHYGVTTSMVGWLGEGASKRDARGLSGRLQGRRRQCAGQGLEHDVGHHRQGHRQPRSDDRLPPEGGAGAAHLRRYAKSHGGYELGTGHAITVVSATGVPGGDTFEITVADPGSAADEGKGSYLYTQSAYAIRKLTLKRVTFQEYVPADSYETEMGGGLLQRRASHGHGLGDPPGGRWRSEVQPG